MVDTPNLKLPYILAAQSQKHLPHNEAIRALDAIVQLTVLDRNLAAPPASPAEGDRYIVDSSPSGAWTGQTGKIAAFQDAAWLFYAPKKGWISWVADENIAVAYDGAAWTTLSSGGGGGVADHGLLTGLADDDHPQYHNNARGDARYTLLNPATFGVNATADATNRLSVGSAASLFNHAGTGGHQIKVNKAAVADTASFLFQSAFSGRAEIGLTGDDDFHFKVSPNGTAFSEAIIINRTTGACTFPNTTFGGVTDGDKGDVVVSSSGAVWNVDTNAVSNAKLADVATATFKGRTTVGTGDPEDLTVAQAKTLLNLNGTNSGDQNTFGIVAVSGQSNVVADAVSDTLTLVAGTNITITTDAATDSVTINAGSSGDVTAAANFGADNRLIVSDGTGKGVVHTPVTVNDLTGSASGFGQITATGIAVNSAGLQIADTDASHNLSVVMGSNLTAARSLSLITGDASRTVTLNGDTTLSGTNTGDQTITLTGPVTGSGAGSFATTIADNAIANTKLADVPTATFKGRTTAGTGDPEDLTVAQAKILLNLTGTNSGDQNTFGTIAVSGQSNVVADAASDTLTLVAGTNITIATDAATDTITINAAGAGGIADGDKGDVTVSGSGATWTIDNNTVTYAKMQDVSATSRFVGRISAGAGDPEELTGAQATTVLVNFVGDAGAGGTKGLVPAPATGDAGKFLKGDGTWGTLSGGSGLTDGDYGDISISGSGTVLSVDANTVTYAKMQDVSVSSRFIGRISAGAGDPEEVTGTQATSLLDVFTSGLKGLAPASGGGTTNYLRADGTWAPPPSGGGVSDGDKGDIVISGGGAVYTLDYPNINFANYLAATRKAPLCFTDFLTTNAVQGDGFLAQAISSGTFNLAPAGGVVDGNHPGVLLLRSSTTTNSGVLIATTSNIHRLAGGEQFDIVFRTAATQTNTTIRFGFADAVSSADATDGVYFELPAGLLTLVGKTSTNSVRTTSATIATLVANTWYHCRVLLNAAATQADFTVWSDAGAQLGTVSITTNIPTALGRETSVALVATNSGVAVADLLLVDYMAYAVPGRVLARGSAS